MAPDRPTKELNRVQPPANSANETVAADVSVLKGGQSLEAVMAGKQFDQKDKQSGASKQQEANLGQKEARQQKEKEAELSQMGERSRESDPPKQRSRWFNLRR
jgi:hypothetical protein